jgi:hypothetical protein
MDGRALATTGSRGIERLGKSVSPAYGVRPRKDAKRQLRNGQGQAYKPQTPWRVQGDKAPDSGRARYALEDSAYEYRPEIGETPKTYYFRCPELGVDEWQRTAGPHGMFAAIKMKMWRIDHDAAWPIALGGKSVKVEMRYEGTNKTMTFLCWGAFAPRYVIERAE